MISNSTSFTQLLGVANPKGTDYKSSSIGPPHKPKSVGVQVPYSYPNICRRG